MSIKSETGSFLRFCFFFVMEIRCMLDFGKYDKCTKGQQTLQPNCELPAVREKATFGSNVLECRTGKLAQLHVCVSLLTIYLLTVY